MEDYVSYLLNAALTAILGVLGWIMRKVITDFNDLEEAVAKNNEAAHASALDLANYKNHVSENYATKDDIVMVRQETQQSLQRIHDRLDDIGDKVDDKMNTVINLLRK